MVVSKQLLLLWSWAALQVLQMLCHLATESDLKIEPVEPCPGET